MRDCKPGCRYVGLGNHPSECEPRETVVVRPRMRIVHVHPQDCECEHCVDRRRHMAGQGPLTAAPDQRDMGGWLLVHNSGYPKRVMEARGKDGTRILVTVKPYTGEQEAGSVPDRDPMDMRRGGTRRPPLALEAKRLCATCGHPENAHNFRHPFIAKLEPKQKCSRHGLPLVNGACPTCDAKSADGAPYERGDR